MKNSCLKQVKKLVWKDPENPQNCNIKLQNLTVTRMIKEKKNTF